jgi:hypothetical protein
MHSQLLHHTDLLRSYICSKNVNNYEHFGDPNKGRCALHDNVEDVHEQAVKRAADEAMAKVKAENPELSEADLMVEVSDRVKQAEAARRGRAAERLNEFPYEMLANQLVHRPGFPRIPPLQGAGAEPPRYVDPFPNYLEIFGQDIPHPIGDRIEAMKSPIHFLLHISINIPPFLRLVQNSSTITRLECLNIFGDP